MDDVTVLDAPDQVDQQQQPQPPSKTKVLYDAVSKNYDLGTFDEFQKKLQDPIKQKAFYNSIGSKYQLGTFDEFQKKIAPVDNATQPKIKPVTSPQTDGGLMAGAVSALPEQPKQKSFFEQLKQDVIRGKKAIEDASDPVLKDQRAQGLIKDDMHSIGMNVDALDISDPALTENLRIYHAGRNKTLDDQLADIRNAGDALLGLDGIDVINDPKFQELQKQAEKLHQQKQQINDSVEFLMGQQLSKNPNADAKEIGKQLRETMQPENKTELQKFYGDKLLTTEQIESRDFNDELAGISAKQDAIVNAVRNKKMSPDDANIQYGQLTDQYRSLEKKYPTVAVDALRSIVGDRIASYRENNDNIAQKAWHNIAVSEAGPFEIKGAIEELRKQGVEISPEQEKQIFESREKIPLTSAVGNFYHKLILNPANKLSNLLQNPFTPNKDNSEREKEFRNANALAPVQGSQEAQITDLGDGKKTVRMGANPEAGKSAGLISWGQLNNIAQVGGTIGAYLTVNKLTGGSMGTLGMSKAASNILGNITTSAFLNYDDYKKSAQEQGASEGVQDVYASARSIVDGLLFSEFSMNKVKAVAPAVEKRITDDFLSKFATGAFDRAKFAEWVVNASKDLGKNVSIMKAQQLSGIVADKIVNPARNADRDITNELTSNIPADVIALLPFSAISGYHTAEVKREPVRQAINMAVADPVQFETRMNELVAQGKVSPRDAYGKINYINKLAAKSLHPDLNTSKINALDAPQRQDYASSLVAEDNLTSSGEGITDKVQKEETGNGVTAEQEFRKGLLLKSEIGGMDFNDLTDQQIEKIPVPEDHKVKTQPSGTEGKFTPVIINAKGEHEVLNKSFDTVDEAKVYGEQRLKKKYFDDNIKNKDAELPDLTVPIEGTDQKGIPVGDNAPALVEVKEPVVKKDNTKDQIPTISEHDVENGDKVTATIGNKDVEGTVTGVGKHKGQIVIDFKDTGGNDRFAYSHQIHNIERGEKQLPKPDSFTEDQKSRHAELVKKMVDGDDMSGSELDELKTLTDIKESGGADLIKQKLIENGADNKTVDRFGQRSSEQVEQLEPTVKDIESKAESDDETDLAEAIQKADELTSAGNEASVKDEKVKTSDQKTQEFNDKVDSIAKKIIDFVTPDAMKGKDIVSQGLSVADVVNGAAKVVKASYKIGKDVKEAVEDAIDYIKSNWDNSWGALPENKLRDLFHEGFTKKIEEDQELKATTKEEVETLLKKNAKSGSFLKAVKDSRIATAASKIVNGTLRAFHPFLLSGGNEARDAAMIIRRNKATEVHENVVADEASKEALDFWNKQERADNVNFMIGMEAPEKHGAIHDSAERILADSYRKRMDAVFDMISQIKDVNFVEDYFPHFWKNPDKARSTLPNLGKVPMEGNKSFLKQRFYQNILDGLRSGLTLATYNPEEMVRLAEQNALHFKTANDIFNESKKAGLLKYFMGKPEDGLVKINDPLFNKRATFVDKEGEAKSIEGAYYAKDAVASVFNNYTGKGLFNRGGAVGTITKSVRHYNNVKNQVQLGIGLFHFSTTTLDATVSGFANGFKLLTTGKPALMAKGAFEMAKSITLLPNLVSTFNKGYEANKAYKTGVAGQEVDNLIDAGARVKLQKIYATDAAYNMSKAWNNFKAEGIPKDWHEFKQSAKDLGKATWNAAWVIPEKLVGHALMSVWVPALKTGGYLNTLKTEIAANPNMTPRELMKAKQRILDAMDNRLGQVVYDNVFWDKTIKDLGFMGVRSLGWTGGTLKAFGTGVGDIPASAKGLVKGNGIANNTAWAMSLPIVIGTYGALYQYMMTGKKPDGIEDYFFPKDGTKNADGTDHRVSLPSYMKDVYAYMRDPKQTASHKLAPFLNDMNEMMSNKDFYGVRIYNPDDSYYQKGIDLLKYQASTMVPFSLKQQTGDSKSLLDAVTSKEGVQKLFGIMPASKEFSRTDTQNAVSDEARKNFNTEARTKEQADLFAARYEVKKALRAGVDYKDIPQELKAKAKYDSKAISQLIKDSKEDYYAVEFKHITPEQQLRVWANMTDDEKKLYSKFSHSEESFDKLFLEREELIKSHPEYKKYVEEMASDKNSTGTHHHPKRHSR